MSFKNSETYASSLGKNNSPLEKASAQRRFNLVLVLLIAINSPSETRSSIFKQNSSMFYDKPKGEKQDSLNYICSEKQSILIHK